MRRIVYFLAKSIYCSKQQRSISKCANAHIDPYLCYQPNPIHTQALLFLCSYFIQSNIIDGADNNNTTIIIIIINIIIIIII